MNTNFLYELKVAIIALLAVLNSTNAPVKPSEPVAIDESMLWPLSGPSKEKWPRLVVGPSSGGGRTTNEQWITTNTNVLLFPVGQTGLTNYLTLTFKTNWITDAEIKVLVTSGQVCRVRGHAWDDGCGVFGCLVIHYDPMRYCRLCGKVETRQIGEWK